MEVIIAYFVIGRERAIKTDSEEGTGNIPRISESAGEVERKLEKVDE